MHRKHSVSMLNKCCIHWHESISGTLCWALRLLNSDDIPDALLILSFNSYNNLIREVVLLFLLHRKETQLYKIMQTCPRSHSWKSQSWNLSPDLYDLQLPSTSAVLSHKVIENIFFFLSYQTCIPVIFTLVIRIRNKYFYIAHSFFSTQLLEYNMSDIT